MSNNDNDIWEIRALIDWMIVDESDVLIYVDWSPDELGRSWDPSWVPLMNLLNYTAAEMTLDFLRKCGVPLPPQLEYIWLINWESVDIE